MTWGRPARLASGTAVACLVVFLWGRPYWFSFRPESAPIPTPPPTSSEVLWVHYHERVPYYVTTSTGVAGVCAEPVRWALERTGLPHRWRLTPPRRQLLWLKTRTHEAHAGVGWFRTPERETWARFSVPVYQDGPLVAVARRHDRRIPEATTRSALLSRRDLVLLTKAGYAYGPWLDPMLDLYRPRRLISPSAEPGLLRMIAMGRADYILMAAEEAEALLASEEGLNGALRTVPLSDAPPGPTRHLLFSAGVPEAWIARINEALQNTAAISHKRHLPQYPGTCPQVTHVGP